MCYLLFMSKALPIEVRFWRKVTPSKGCWIWQGTKNQRGYGQMRMYPSGALSAHRVSYELHKGPIPAGLIVRHSCDNPSCVNPAHLLAGTHKDNARDCIDRGRKATSHAPHTRLRKVTDDQVREIRQDTRKAHIVAVAHGISECAVYNIRARRRKALVPD